MPRKPTREELEQRRDAEFVRQREVARAWMAEKWTATDKRCPICESNDWEITEAGEIPTADSAAIHRNSMSAGVWPVFLVVCQTCAYTMLFNALQAGVVDEKPI